MNKSIFIIVVFYIINIVYAQRRIKNGTPLTTVKNYVAYFLKSEISPKKYDAWVCGGAIVSATFIITSAACVEDVDYMYAIAGLGKYMKLEDTARDPCALALRKKVVLSCVPKAYNMSYDKIEQWSYIDIAAVKVESPYDFSLTAPIKECSIYSPPLVWVPDKIPINYEAKNQRPGLDTLILGWGHKNKWRDQDDTTDYNQENLQYGSTLIEQKSSCKKYYSKLPLLQETIDKYMICTLKMGNIDDKGDQIITSKPALDGCNGEDDDKCKNETTSKMYNAGTEMNIRDNAMRPIERSGPLEGLLPQILELEKLEAESNDYVFDDVSINLRRNNLKNSSLLSRRSGICQNDHGGPIVTWVGTHEILIGVASVFRISKRSECVGPYLYTSTYCNGKFLDCVINDLDDNSTTRAKAPNSDSFYQGSEDHSRRLNAAICSLPAAKRGFEIITRRISWKRHPDGPAKNEKADDIFERPQIPLYNYNGQQKKQPN